MTISSNSSNTTNCKDLRNPTVAREVLPVLYFFVFVGGLLLNALAAWIFCHIPSHSSFVVYLKNIVTTDLIMVMTVPFKILSDSHLGPWQLQAIVCRYTLVIFYNSMYLSIIFLGLISFDRYLKIVRPMRNLTVQKVTFAKFVSVGCWLFMIAFALPNVLLTNKTPTKDTATQCYRLKSELGKAWHHFIILKCQVIFWITFVLLIICYSAILKKLYWSDRNLQKESNYVKKRANRNIFSIMVVFIVCFVPYQIIRLPYDQGRKNKINCTTFNILYYAKEASQLLCAFNICLDPIIYFLLCKLFTKLLFKKMRLQQDLEIEMS
ncbi:P2Y purinoceptor 14-like [Stegostoma tigrinum]|uniref:P2Y purinoceptor 14-like n=1 Tax=Stegostoma tigrinum TaxID=3053191 RepID=UPI00286FE0EE|nr:P2Y purinoceptor 14-like [Stegostoma tigrinum]